MRNRIQWHLTDVLIGGLLIALLCGVGLSAAALSREASNRIKCASNLRQIGQAILIYMNENIAIHAPYPRTTFTGGDDPKPVWGTPYARNKELGPVETGADPFISDKDPRAKYRPEPNDVTAAMFLLIRNEDIGSETFICPSAEIPKWDFGGGKNSAQNWTNWDGNASLARHLSYSYQNPYAGKPAIKAGFRLNGLIDASFAVVADMNPGGDAVLNVTPDSPADVMRTANSMNHQREGQNVLFGDGHVAFEDNPFCGKQGDNIYTANGPEVVHPARAGQAAITASPVDQVDSILLPTATNIGFKPPNERKPVSDQDIAKLQATLIGTYARDGDAAHDKGRLTITDTTIQMVSGATMITYTYKIVGVEGDDIELEATAPDSPPKVLTVTTDYPRISLVGNERLSGDWLAK
jgi:prepilin-type processing-associated H-X9-DG protein